jgi:FixJ family two-component response regulator
MVGSMNKATTLIAVVDDEESVCKALKRLLRSMGFAVETFPSGAAFLQSLQSHVPHCVVLDLHMPAVNGFDVQAELAASGVQVPVIVITGYDTDETRERVLRAGAAAYLRKPVDDRSLLDAIASALVKEPEAP